MIEALRKLAHGAALRHRPVALGADAQRPVRATALSPAGTRDVTERLFPLSLRPLLVGLARMPGEPVLVPNALSLAEPGGERLGSIRLASEGSIAHAGGLIDILRPTGSAAHCVPAPYRAWQHLLARRQARLTARRPGAFAMDFADLKALNVFYMMPRPVYLVTVIDEGGDNLFPMDLVGPLGDELFLLALRRTSPSIAPMREGRRIVLSGLPARLKEAAYRLGAHHKEAGIDRRALELATRPSPLFGWPVPADALDGRELEVLQSEAIGSHVLFVTRVAGQARFGDEPQLCHVSDMYARWRSAKGRPFANA